MVNQVGHAASVVKPLLVVEGLQRLAGAVGLLGRDTTLVRVQGRGVELGLFGAAGAGEGAVSTVLEVHAVGDGGEDGRGQQQAGVTVG